MVVMAFGGGGGGDSCFGENQQCLHDEPRYY